MTIAAAAAAATVASPLPPRAAAVGVAREAASKLHASHQKSGRSGGICIAPSQSHIPSWDKGRNGWTCGRIHYWREGRTFTASMNMGMEIVVTVLATGHRTGVTLHGLATTVHLAPERLSRVAAVSFVGRVC